MTQFMLAHPWLFTFQVGFVSLLFSSVFMAIGNAVGQGDVHHHHHYNSDGGSENDKR